MSKTETTLSTPGTSTRAYAADMSSDGRFVLSLGDGTDGGFTHRLSLTDMQTGLVQTVATAADTFDLSDGGRYVAYTQRGSVSNTYDLHVWDRVTQSDRVTVSGFELHSPQISQDGATIYFVAEDQRLIGAYAIGNQFDLYAVDVGSGAVHRVAEKIPITIELSAGGRYIAAETTPDGLDASNGVSTNHIVRIDVTDGSIVDIKPTSLSYTHDIEGFSLSGDGRFAVYNSRGGVVLVDIPGGTTRIISSPLAGDQGGSFSSEYGRISADGTRVVYDLSQSIYTSGVFQSTTHVVVKDIASGIVADVGNVGIGTGFAYPSSISADGLTIAFSSGLQLTSSDTDSVPDGYVTHFFPPPLFVGRIAGDDIVNAAEKSAVTVTGVLDEPGVTIKVTSPSGAVATTTTTSDRNWSVTVSAAGVSDGNHTFSIEATDDVGLKATATRDVLFDSIPPSISYSINHTGSINAAQLHASTITGLSDAPGQVATFTIDGTPIGHATVQQPDVSSGSFGAFSLGFDASRFHDGLHILGVSIADPAGNVTSETFPFDIDTTSPKITITSVAGDDVVSSQEADGPVPIVGTSDAIGQTVEIVLGDTVIGTAVVAQDGSWSTDVSTGAAELHDVIEARVADPAGNVGTASTDIVVSTNVIRVSVAADGSEVQGAWFDGPTVSANGRYILFETDGQNNLATDFGDLRSTDYRAVVKDVVTGSVTTVASGLFAEISADGRHVVSYAYPQYEVRDLVTGAVSPVNVTASGEPDNGVGQATPTQTISADGRFVVFISAGTNLVPGLLPTPWGSSGERLFVKDMQTGGVSLVSFAELDPVAGEGLNTPHIGGGRYVPFETTLAGPATDDHGNLLDSNNDYDIYLRDIQTGAVTLVSATPTGTAGNGESWSPEISPDGRYVAFLSYATDLAPGATSSQAQLYLRDLQTGTTKLLSLARPDATPLYPITAEPATFSFSDDDRYLGFVAAIGENGLRDYEYYVYDLQTGALKLASTGSAGVDIVDAASGYLSADGHYAVFSSNASDLVPHDTNGGVDIFMRNLWADNLTLDPVTGDDRITQAERSTAQAIGGTTTASGGTVSITLDGAEIATASVQPNGAWTTTIDTSQLPAGQHHLAAAIIDPLGFISADGALLDVVRGPQHVGVQLVNDTGRSATDLITSDPTIRYTLSEPGDTVDFSIGGGIYTATPPVFPTDGSYAISVRAHDATGAFAGQTTISIQLDTTAPDTPAAPVLANDTGASNSDKITSNPAITYPTPAAGDILLYKLDTGSFGTTAPTFATNGSADGVHTVTIAEQDIAGNVSGTASLTFTLNTAALSLALATDSGIAGDGVTNVGTVNVSGLESGASWEYAIDGGAFVAGSGTSFTLTGDGAKTVLVHQVDGVGHASANASLNFTLDTTAAAPSLALAPDSGIGGDGVGTVNVAGLEAGASWEYAVDGGAFVAGHGGSFTVTGDGPRNVLVHQIDAAGNVSADASLSFTLDTTSAALLAALKQSGISIEEARTAVDQNPLPWDTDIAVFHSGGTFRDIPSRITGVSFSTSDNVNVDIGGSGPKVITTGSGDDTIFTSSHGGTNDAIFAGAGNDTISAGAGDDTVYGGDGDDLIGGGDGDDSLIGGLGDDLIYGDAGSDTLAGDDGNDMLEGNSGDDLLFGGAGDDNLWGSAGSDTLLGGDGDDALAGGDGDDSLAGEEGDDLVAGGIGNDTLSGGVGDDTLYGDAGNDWLDGGNGNDTIFGGTGNDVINGGDGDDLIAWAKGDGNDNIDGGDGNDVLFIGAIRSEATVTTDHSTGITTVAFKDGAALTVANVETIQFADDVTYLS